MTFFGSIEPFITSTGAATYTSELSVGWKPGQTRPEDAFVSTFSQALVTYNGFVVMLFGESPRDGTFPTCGGGEVLLQ